MSELTDRKAEHLDLCATDDVAFKGRTTLLEQVTLVHDALPELAVDEISLTTRIIGKEIHAPLVIAAMTGGTERAHAINRTFAEVAEEKGLAFGFGSMRPWLQEGNRTGFLVRDVAPTIPLFGNVGLVQAVKASTQQLADIVGEAGCDALCVHLNPAMEVIQPGGDNDFRGGLDTITRLAHDLPVPIIVKETGCGLSRSVGERLVRAGVHWVDVSGAGGTSWVGVETLRAKAKTQRLGQLYWDWGIPTAGSVLQLRGLGLDIIATGGIHTGLDVAKALALGARAAGIARRFLMAYNEGGRQGVVDAVDSIIDELRIACLLTGSHNVLALSRKPVVLGPDLERWAL